MSIFRRLLLNLLVPRANMKKILAFLVLLASLLILLSLKTVNHAWIEQKAQQSHIYHNIPTNTKDTKGPPPTRKIVLLTYGRSGSTFTSELIQRDPGVFYTFEPLHGLVRRFVANRNGLHNFFTGANQSLINALNERAKDIVESFLTCRFESLDINDIANYQLRNSADSRLLWGCIQRRKDNWTPAQVVYCFLQARKVCLSRSVKMVKTIRFRGSTARQLLQKYNDLKLIYLTRDPRGTLTSQRRVFNAFKWYEIGNFSKNYCQVFREDLAVIEQLMEEYPDRVRVLRYETLAENPITMSENVYKFLGLNYTRAVKDWVFNNTLAGKRPDNAYGTVRSNSTATAYSWRSRINVDITRIIDTNCKDVYEKLGYVPVNSQAELANPHHSLRHSVSFHGHQL